MNRVLLIVLAFSSVLASDLFVDIHHAAVQRQVAAHEVHPAVFAYENPVLTHSLHYFEEWVFAAMLLVALLSFRREFSSCGFGQCLWGMGIFVLVLSLGFGLFIDAMTGAMETQFGLHSLSFTESTGMSFGLEIIALVVVGALAWLGPPRGWSADAQAA